MRFFYQGRHVRPFFMGVVNGAYPCGMADQQRRGRQRRRWLEVVDASELRRQIAALLDPEASGDRSEWEVQAYEGLPDFGLHPDVDELLAYLDAVDEYGAAFEAWWATQPFDYVIQAADAFADRYQGTYTDVAEWAHHYLTLIGEQIEAGMDPEAYGHAAASKGELLFVAATEGAASMCSGMIEHVLKAHAGHLARKAQAHTGRP